MTMCTMVKVGRREFNYNTFVKAVQESKTYSGLCKSLGMNETVQTTINTLKVSVEALKLNTDHFTFKYKVTDKVLQSAQNNTKQFNLIGVNRQYYEAFEQSFDKITSWQQYKVHCGDYLESLKEKDFATRTVEELETYVNNNQAGEKTKQNCKAHIRSMMIYIVRNNIEDAFNKVNKKMLVWLI